MIVLKLVSPVLRKFLLCLLSIAICVTCSVAQEVTIPDPALNTVVRELLQKPNGPLSAQDMLGLTNLTAISRNITNLQGLNAARNLNTLVLDDNRITVHAFPDALTNLTQLAVLDLSGNPLTHLALPNGLTNLTSLRVETSGLTNFTLPFGLRRLAQLRLGFNRLSILSLPLDMTNLSLLSVFQNQLTNVAIPWSVTNLTEMNLDGNRLARLNLPSGLKRLDILIASGNQLANFTVPPDVTGLRFLRLNDNQLTRLLLPAGLTNLTGLFLHDNQLTNLALSPGLNHLTQMELARNQLARLTLPPDLTSLAFLNLTDNHLAALTLPPDLQQLTGLFMAGNSLTNFVLSEPLAVTGLASVVDSFRNQGIPVFTYLLTPRLAHPLKLLGAFKFGITGPPGIYTVLGSTNFTEWNAVGFATNALGDVNFFDVTAGNVPQKFYRTLPADTSTNMVFVPPNTFIMGSPANEPGRTFFEGAQATVTLTRGFWIGKYEVTQGEYLSVMGENPSNFPGDPDRPVSSVSWFDATNYCDRLTQRELAAGRIPAGSRYRLPTEAEWECAARAGTTTRFSYGDDDQNNSDLKHHAWYLDLAILDLTVHPVGQKIPNPWGLYDMHGNVWEWCQDWYGEQSGGVQVDPAGPAGNANSNKVIRGGAYDYPDNECRSASRFFRHPIAPDSDVGFRVVLAKSPEFPD